MFDKNYDDNTNESLLDDSDTKSRFKSSQHKGRRKKQPLTDIKVSYWDGRPGAGKTRKMTMKMATVPGKWIYAVDRNDVFDEREELIRSFWNRKNPKVVQINCVTSNDVRKGIREAAQEYKEEEHVVLIVTHAGLLMSDLSGFHGWSLVIDENINVWQLREVNTKMSSHMLKQDLKIVKRKKDKFNRIMLKGTANINDVKDDTYACEVAELYIVAKQGTVYCSAASFENSDDWEWWTIWDFKQLRPFKDVFVVANSFTSSLAYQLMAAEGITFTAMEFGGPEYEPRTLTIKYFDENNKATASYFETKKGQDVLKKISKYFSDNPVDIWSCNNDKEKVRYEKLLNIPGMKLSPAVAGSNEYMRYTSGAFIYSAKPTTAEVEKLKQFKINREQIVRARETEQIIQFATRLALRNPADKRDCLFYVYDKFQAQALEKYFNGLSIPLEVVLVHEDLNIPARFDTDEIKRAKKAELNRQNYQRNKPLVLAP